ncbi:MAG TPA: NAD(P)-binding protein [Ilumatobacteraceae bacterium]|nr:NAD(P)-binding protein [Ilumatobacteraceae bacterium]
MTATTFDPDALREKYREERDKRLREAGNEQYIEVAGEFERYVHDPYVEPIEREPLTDEVEVLIIGGGFGGLLAGARLRDAGIDDIRVVEKGGDFGGTWYWNRYPGAACDVESYVYLPLLEEIGYMPTEKYSHAAEILATARRSATTSTSTATRASRPRSPRCAGTTPTVVGSCAPTATTRCAPATS